jgi:DNA-binding protein H-NS
MDLTQLNLSEIQALEKQVNNEIKRRELEEIRLAFKKIHEIALSVGVSPEHFLGTSKQFKKKVAKRYRHPHNPSLEWTGRGRNPRWVVQWLAEGHSMEELRIES